LLYIPFYKPLFKENKQECNNSETHKISIGIFYELWTVPVIIYYKNSERSQNRFWQLLPKPHFVFHIYWTILCLPKSCDDCALFYLCPLSTSYIRVCSMLYLCVYSIYMSCFQVFTGDFHLVCFVCWNVLNFIANCCRASFGIIVFVVDLAVAFPCLLFACLCYLFGSLRACFNDLAVRLIINFYFKW